MLTRRDFFAGLLAAIAVDLRNPRAGRHSPLRLSIETIDILPRELWAKDRPALDSPTAEDVRFLLVHHSASTNEYREEEVESILQGFFDYHKSSDKGWSDIAYNFLIDRFGRVWEGRAGSLDGPVAGDATGGNQGFSQLVCLIGDFTSELPSPAAIASSISVLVWLANKYEVPTTPGSEVTFISRGSNRWPAGMEVVTSPIVGHREMSVTSCPGDAFYEYVKGDLLADVDATRIQPDSATTTQSTTSTAAATTSSATTRQAGAATTSTAPQPAGSQIEATNAGSSEPQSSDPWLMGLAAGAFALVLGVILKRRPTGRQDPHEGPPTEKAG